MAVQVDIVPGKSPTMRKLAERIKKKGKLNTVELETMAKAVADQKLLRNKEFLRLVKEMAGVTDDQFLEDLRPYLLDNKGKGGRGKGEPSDLTDRKVLLAYRLAQRGLTYDQIGEQLKVSPHMVWQYLTKAKEALRVDPHTVDVPQQIGETLAFYSDVREMALYIASQSPSRGGVPWGAKMQAMSTALQVERDRTDFLTRVGVYSPSVIQSFQQVVMTQLSVSMGAGQNKESGVESFMHELAKGLMETALVRHGNQLQNQDVQDAEVVGDAGA